MTSQAIAADTEIEREPFGARRVLEPLLPPERIIKISQPADISDVGVYFLILGRVVVYVGQSGRVRRRIQEHRIAGVVTFDRWAMIECAGADRIILETRYIRAFAPAHNTVSPPSWDIEDPNTEEAYQFARVLALTERPRDKVARAKLAAKRSRD